MIAIMCMYREQLPLVAYYVTHLHVYTCAYRLPPSPPPPPPSAQERRAQHLLHPQGYNCPDLTEDRVRVVVFRDEKGVKTPVFDSQVHCDTEEKEKVRVFHHVREMVLLPPPPLTPSFPPPPPPPFLLIFIFRSH